MPSIKELREEFSKVHAEATKIVDDAVAAGTELTAEVKAANDLRFSRLETIKNIIDSSLKFAKIALDKGEVVVPTDGPAKIEFEKSHSGTGTGDKLDRAEFSKAFNRWANSGSMETKFATITTATQSGIFLPVEVAQPLAPAYPNTFRQAFGIYGTPVMTTPTTGTINIPVLSATSGGVVAENATTETESEPGTSESIVSKCATYQSDSTWFSNQALSAVDYDLVGSLTPVLTNSKELGLESAISAALIADAGVTQNVVADHTTSFTYANLVALDNALPKKFQMQKVIVLSAAAYSAACALTFASGPAVLTTDANGVRRLNGTPVLRSDYFQAFGVTQVIGAIFSVMGFHLRDAGPVNLQRYVQVPARPNQTGFNLFAYHAYGYAPSAVAKFISAAS